MHLSSLAAITATFVRQLTGPASKCFKECLAAICPCPCFTQDCVVVLSCYILLFRVCVSVGHLPSGVSLWAAGQQLVATGGLGALYKGNLVNVLRSAPARAVDFFAFDL